jgi:hypothetical protein
VALWIEENDGRFAAKAAAKGFIESVAMKDPDISSKGAVLALPSSPYTS